MRQVRQNYKVAFLQAGRLAFVFTVSLTLATAVTVAPASTHNAPSVAQRPGDFEVKLTQDQSSALAVWKALREADIEDYLKAEKPNERLLEDFKRFANAGKTLGYSLDDLEFLAWLKDAEGQRYLTSEILRDHGAFTFEEYALVVYNVYKAQKDLNAGDFDLYPDVADSPYVAWVKQTLNNPIILGASTGAVVLALGTWDLVFGVAKGAFAAGPIGGVMSALLEPVVRPFRERAQLIGARRFEHLGKTITLLLNNESKKQDLIKSTETSVAMLKDMQQKVSNSMNFDMTLEDELHNMDLIRRQWSDAVMVWNKTIVPHFQAGRNIMIDAIVFRNKDFMSSVNNFANHAVTLEGRMEAIVERYRNQKMQEAIFVQTRKNPDYALAEKRFAEAKKIQTLFQNIGTLLAQRYAQAEDHAASAKIRKIDQMIERRVTELEALGVRRRDWYKFINYGKQMKVALRQIAATLASQIFHDFQFPELNRELPENVRRAYKVMQENFGHQFYHESFKPEVQRMIRDMGYRIGSLNKAARASASPSVTAQREAVEGSFGGSVRTGKCLHDTLIELLDLAR